MMKEATLPAYKFCVQASCTQMILTIHLILVLQRTGLLLGKKQSPQNKSSTIRQDKKV
ncbi:hypothetical protein JHK84_030325 [Glycine max]|nr:hypothetical protein JHK87_029986 [Glycine soja]KAG5144782.1 hypothetical protein JHK84_030325 [Glycine max]KAH1157655.1 hypothetical protein GYH30_030060 [Glycine max]